MTPDDIAGTDTDQQAYADAAHDTRPDADTAPDPDELVRNQDTDAVKWAEAFVPLAERQPELAIDAGCMVGWFANAIEIGRSVGRAQGKRDASLALADDAASGHDSRPDRGCASAPDADESVAAIRALCDLCETHDLPVPFAITPARRGWEVTRVQVDQENWAAWHYALAVTRVYVEADDDSTTLLAHYIGNGDHAGHRYQLVSVVG